MRFRKDRIDAANRAYGGHSDSRLAIVARLIVPFFDLRWLKHAFTAIAATNVRFKNFLFVP